MTASLAAASIPEILESGPAQEFAMDVRSGLRKKQKELPSKYLYDAVGSALFEAITRLPEYGLTRADERLLNRHAREIADHLAPGLAPAIRVVELGSGSGRKAVPILKAIGGGTHLTTRKVVYYPVDVSQAALEQCRREVSVLPNVRIRAIRAFYVEGLKEAVKSRARSERILVLFLGSSLGNFDRRESAHLLFQIQRMLRPGDALLLGTDLVKPQTELILAYDDPAGVTAAFNLNMLARMNRELGARFQLRQFRHEARWSPEQRRVEMHLQSLAAQKVEIPGARCQASFEPGETIWTESSYKFEPAELVSLAKQSGFTPEDQWIDREWPFAENLWMIPAQN